MSLAHQHLAILGGGRSGLAAAALALREGAVTTMYDTCDGEHADALRLRCSGALPGLRVVTGAEAVNPPADERFDLVVTSPGISLASGWGMMMAARAPRAIGEIEFAWPYFAGRTIGITGTNGKTTTTEMIRELLLAAGYRTLAAGNHGLPLAEVVTHHPGTAWLALELSSFQLETIDRYRPEVAVWLNFAPDHMDRYATLREYRDAKEQLFRNLDADAAAIIPHEEAATLDTRGARTTTFSTNGNEGDWHISGACFCHGDVVLMPVDAAAVRGRHNHANLLAAWAAVDAATGIDSAAARGVFARFSPPAHRYERVATIDGIDFINDSKSTNLHSLDTALHAEDRDYVLVLGGKDKSLDFRDLATTIARRCKAVVAIGEIRPHLRDVLAHLLTFREADSLEAAVHTARSLACHGDAVLLSPGTSSYDMFRDYIDRGEHFRSIVTKLEATSNPPPDPARTQAP